MDASRKTRQQIKPVTKNWTQVESDHLNKIYYKELSVQSMFYRENAFDNRSFEDTNVIIYLVKNCITTICKTRPNVMDYRY